MSENDIPSRSTQATLPSTPEPGQALRLPNTPPLMRRMACWLYEGMLMFGVVFIAGEPQRKTVHTVVGRLDQLVKCRAVALLGPSDDVLELVFHCPAL